MNLPTDSNTLLRHNVSLANYCTMQVGGRAQYFAEPTTEADLVELIDFAKKEQVPFCIIGKGSNIIFPDEGYPGLVITLIHFEANLMRADTKTCILEASGGTHLYRLVLFARDQGLAGASFLCNVPGTLGGAVMMNAGFSRYAGQTNAIGDIIWEITVIDSDGQKKVIPRKDLSFSYRTSNLKDCIVLSAKLKLWKRKPEVIEKEIRKNFHNRNQKQDLRYPSSGSIFKNPKENKKSAGQLIEEIGFKGRKVGGAMISEKHANYLVNCDRATSSDVKQLIDEVQKAVFRETGVKLEREIQFIQAT